MLTVPQSLASDPDLSHEQFRVLSILYALVPCEERDDPFAWPSIAEIVARSGMTRSAVHRALQALTGKGLIHNAPLQMGTPGL
jgi:DNA-binding MarR family transcriptional regulator